MHNTMFRSWLSLCFFTLCTLCLCGSFLPAAEPVKVGVIGLDTSHAPAFVKVLNDPKAEPDVAGFRAGRIGLNKMVLFSYAPSYTRSAKARALASALTGTEAALPDTYGYTAEALAALLNDWRARATRAGAS